MPLIRKNNMVDSVDTELIEPPHCAIIGCMVEMSKITRSICQQIFLSNPSIDGMITLADRIEIELDGWVEKLPHAIRPHTQTQLQQPLLRSAKDTQWAKRQRLVLSIRYHNLKILLFGSLLIRSLPAERATVPGCLDNIHKGLDSAKQTISIIYQTYAYNDFFQTWYAA